MGGGQRRREEPASPLSNCSSEHNKYDQISCFAIVTSDDSYPENEERENANFFFVNRFQLRRHMFGRGDLETEESRQLSPTSSQTKKFLLAGAHLSLLHFPFVVSNLGCQNWSSDCEYGSALISLSPQWLFEVLQQGPKKHFSHRRQYKNKVL